MSGDGSHYWDGNGIQGMDFHHIWVRWIEDEPHQELIGVFRIEVVNMWDEIQYTVLPSIFISTPPYVKEGVRGYIYQNHFTSMLQVGGKWQHLSSVINAGRTVSRHVFLCHSDKEKHIDFTCTGSKRKQSFRY